MPCSASSPLGQKETLTRITRTHNFVDLVFRPKSIVSYHHTITAIHNPKIIYQSYISVMVRHTCMQFTYIEDQFHEKHVPVLKICPIRTDRRHQITLTVYRIMLLYCFKYFTKNVRVMNDTLRTSQRKNRPNDGVFFFIVDMPSDFDYVS